MSIGDKTEVVDSLKTKYQKYLQINILFYVFEGLVSIFLYPACGQRLWSGDYKTSSVRVSMHLCVHASVRHVFA